MGATNNSSNNTVGQTNLGAVNTLTIQNNDNSSTASSARCNITVGGLSAGPAWTQYTAGTSRSWVHGMNTGLTSQNLEIHTAASDTASFSNTPIWTADTTGNITAPLNSAFSYYFNGLTSGVTGTVTLPFNTKLFDQNGSGNFNSTTHNFTAPSTGIYQFDVGVQFANLTTSVTSLQLLIQGPSNAYLLRSWGAVPSGLSTLNFSGSAVISLAKNSTIYAYVTIAGASISINGIAANQFLTFISGNKVD